MLKDIVVNLSGRRPAGLRGRLRDLDRGHVRCAIVGVAFVYEPVIPDGVLGGVPVDLIEVQREENTKAPRTRSAGSRRRRNRPGFPRKRASSTRAFGGAADAVRPDRAALRPRGGRPGAARTRRVRGTVDRGRAVRVRPPLVVVPYIQKRGLKLDRVMACWDGGRTGRASDRRRDAASSSAPRRSRS